MRGFSVALPGPRVLLITWIQLLKSLSFIIASHFKISFVASSICFLCGQFFPCHLAFFFPAVHASLMPVYAS